MYRKDMRFGIEMKLKRVRSVKKALSSYILKVGGERGGWRM